MKYVLFMLVVCLQSAAFGENPFDQFDPPKIVHVSGGESIILVVPAMLGLWILLREFFKAPILLLRIVSNKDWYRLLLGILDWAFFLTILIVSIGFGIACKKQEIGLKVYCVFGAITSIAGWGLRLLNGHLVVFTEVAFAEPYGDGKDVEGRRYRYVKAMREAAGRKRPIFLERYFSARAAREHIIQMHLNPRPRSGPQFMPIAN